MRSAGARPNRWPLFIGFGLVFGLIVGLIAGFTHHGGFGWTQFRIAVVVCPMVAVAKRAATLHGRANAGRGAR